MYDNATIWGPNGDVVDLSGIIHVDGVSYRYMGGPESQYFLPKTTVRQIGLQVLPTQTIYSFAVGTSIHFNMTWYVLC